jgi:hypothetical protein
VFVEAGSSGLTESYSFAFGPDGNLHIGSLHQNVLRYNGKTGAFMDVFVPLAPGDYTVLLACCSRRIFVERAKPRVFGVTDEVLIEQWATAKRICVARWHSFC